MHWLVTLKKEGIFKCWVKFFSLLVEPETWAEGIYKWATDSVRIGNIEIVKGIVTGDETTGKGFKACLRISI